MITVAFLAAAVALLLFVRMSLRAELMRGGLIILRVFIGPLIVFEKELRADISAVHIPRLYIKRGNEWRELDIYRKRRKNAKKIRLLKPAAEALRIDELYVTIGAGDAANTALLCGALMAAVSAALCAFGKDAGSFDVAPDFKSADAVFRFKCIISLTVWNIIKKLMKAMVKKHASDRKHFADNDG